MPKLIKLPHTLFPLFALVVTLVAYLFLAPTTNLPVEASTHDTSPPHTTHTLNPTEPDGNNDWYVSNVQVTLQSTDLESGVASINYRLNGGTWQTVNFSNTQNLVANPSFETTGSTTTGIANWEATVVDPEGTYSHANISAPGFQSQSARIDATGGAWHGVNNKESFAPATPYSNMSASFWLRTQNVSGTASFKVYAVTEDPGDPTQYISHEIAQSSTLTGTNDWTYISLPFTVSVANAIGVYVDAGLSGPGTVWADAATITSSSSTTQTSFTVGIDGAAHQVEYYSVDNAGNAESYSCIAPKENCIEFKIDQTPPGNWRNAGAFRQIPGPSNHHLFVHADVDGGVSGLSTNSNIYQYLTNQNDTYGVFSNLAQCNSTWLVDDWAPLQEGVTTDGQPTAYLMTQHTSFCNSNWRECKVVRFYAEDMAGNTRTQNYCINGPWIRLRGEGIVRSNQTIQMISEPEGDNTDRLIQISGASVDFFKSENEWVVRNSPQMTGFSYDDLLGMVSNTEALYSPLPTVSGVFVSPATNVEIRNNTLPSNYGTETFDQIIFVPGDLRISRNIEVSADSTALFVVGGDVEIARSVTNVGVAIIADGNFYTAHDVSGNQTSNTLELRGFFAAQNFVFQRTLQGTNNETFPTEDFIYEPKYLVQLKPYFTSGAVTWR